MRSVLSPVAGLVLAGSFLLAVSVSPAWALKQFKDQFEAKYVKAESKDAHDVALKEAFDKAKCLVCHEPETKKHRNVYGRALAELIQKSDKDDAAKIQKALDTIAGKHSDPNNPASPTFGDLIKQGKLPATK